LIKAGGNRHPQFVLFRENLYVLCSHDPFGKIAHFANMGKEVFQVIEPGEDVLSDDVSAKVAVPAQNRAAGYVQITCV
jgi:hypothetical protein